MHPYVVKYTTPKELVLTMKHVLARKDAETDSIRQTLSQETFNESKCLTVVVLSGNYEAKSQ